MIFYSLMDWRQLVEDELKNKRLNQKMETLKDLMVANGDDKSRIFYLKVIIIRPGFSEEWMGGLRWI